MKRKKTFITFSVLIPLFFFVVFIYSSVSGCEPPGTSIYDPPLPPPHCTSDIFDSEGRIIEKDNCFSEYSPPPPSPSICHILGVL